MFIYLAKKIAIPNGVGLHTVSWNNDKGYIACGGENGLLKVIQLDGHLENQGSIRKLNEAGAPSSQLSMNQTLEGHHSAVLASTWNSKFQKLTTSDADGLIIVWILFKGQWYEEMINNRNKSVVADMHWDREGQKICIAYSDGAVIVGSVDGNRIWGKELKSKLAYVRWSPDSKLILFGTEAGDLELYDHTGVYISKVKDCCNENVTQIKISTIDWYSGANGYLCKQVPCLAIGYENGKLQLMRNEKDKTPLIIDTQMKNMIVRWSHNGSLLAASGTQSVQTHSGEEKEVCVLQVYNPYGEFLKSMKVPGSKITSLSWDHSGVRIALSVDSSLYFANLRPDYKWTFFASEILLFTHYKKDSPLWLATFWNTKTQDAVTRTLSNVALVTSFEDYCLIVTLIDEERAILSIYTGIGILFETKTVDFVPMFAAMGRNYVYVASGSYVQYWQFKILASAKLIALDALRKNDSRERGFHIDDMKVIGIADTDFQTDFKAKRPAVDSICAMCASDHSLLVAKQSGILLQFTMPSMTLENKYTIPANIQSIRLNCDGSRVAVLDSSCVLRLLQLERSPYFARESVSDSKSKRTLTSVEIGSFFPFERKDVWAMIWSTSDPSVLTVIEKAKLVTIRDLDAEDPIPCNGYICSVEELSTRIAYLDEIYSNPEKLSKNMMERIDGMQLRQAKELWDKAGPQEAMSFAERHSFATLYRFIAHEMLKNLDLSKAHQFFTKCSDYQGVQLLKKLQKLEDPQKQQAEVAIYFEQYEEAERLYLDLDRKDLAIDLRARLGDWFRVVQLVKSGGNADDRLLEHAWNSIGAYYYDRQQWAEAINWYSLGRHEDRLADCHYLLEDFENLENVSCASDNKTLLKKLASRFVSVGMCDQAVAAYLKVGDINLAINACVQLNQWNTAIELARKHDHKEIESLLIAHGTTLLKQSRKLEAIELFRKANLSQKAAFLLYDMALQEAKNNSNPMDVKKIVVLAALEMERYNAMDAYSKGLQNNTLLDKAMSLDPVAIRTSVNDPWRHAEAYHWYILAQRQFYDRNFDGAILTCLHLRNFEDVLPTKTIFSLLALAAFHGQNYGTCSKAFVKLESLTGLEEDEKEEIESLAFSIFTKYSPVDPRHMNVVCGYCNSSISERDSLCPQCHEKFPVCMVTGRPILDPMHFVCSTCKHQAIDSEMTGLCSCPLCHAPL